MNKNRFKILIGKYRQDSLNRAEYQELLDLLGGPELDQNLDQILNRYWEEAEFQPHTSSSHTIQQGSSTLQLFNSSTFKPQHFKNPTSKPYLWWGIAAAALLLIGLFFYLGRTHELLGNREIVYTTGFGERLEVELNDGSQITLNANSELRWSEAWKSKGSREAILKGEAFFEVKKQKGIPFTVNTNDVVVKVLGTSFNVDTREEKTEIYLDEGRVNLKLKDGQDKLHYERNMEVIMKPGDQVKYSTKEKKIEKLEGQDLITAASWKKNVLNFKNMEFRNVLEQLREIYGQSFECTDGNLLKTPMYIGVPYADWEAVRQALELSLNIEFQKIESRRYKVKSTIK